jgi:hypothetical protein
MLNPKIILLLKKVIVSITEKMRTEAFDLIQELLAQIYIGGFPVDLITAMKIRSYLMENRNVQAIKELRNSGGEFDGPDGRFHVIDLKSAKIAVEEWKKNNCPMPV